MNVCASHPFFAYDPEKKKKVMPNCEPFSLAAVQLKMFFLVLYEQF